MERGKLYVGRGETNRIRTRDDSGGREYSQEMTARTGEYIDQFTTVPDHRTTEEILAREPKCVVAHRMKSEKKMDIVKEGVVGEATEYFCFNCGQLRLSLIKEKTLCKGCGSTNIIIGKCGELDKQKLKKEFCELRKPTRDD